MAWHAAVALHAGAFHPTWTLVGNPATGCALETCGGCRNTCESSKGFSLCPDSDTDGNTFLACDTSTNGGNLIFASGDTKFACTRGGETRVRDITGPDNCNDANGVVYEVTGDATADCGGACKSYRLNCCLIRYGSPPPSPPSPPSPLPPGAPPPPAAPGLCSNTCPYRDNGSCEDTGPGGAGICAYGSDCNDCGARMKSPPPNPPLPPRAPPLLPPPSPLPAAPPPLLPPPVPLPSPPSPPPDNSLFLTIFIGSGVLVGAVLLLMLAYIITPERAEGLATVIGVITNLLSVVLPFLGNSGGNAGGKGDDKTQTVVIQTGDTPASGRKVRRRSQTADDTSKATDRILASIASRGVTTDSITGSSDVAPQSERRMLRATTDDASSSPARTSNAAAARRARKLRIAPPTSERTTSDSNVLFGNDTSLSRIASTLTRLTKVIEAPAPPALRSSPLPARRLSALDSSKRTRPAFTPPVPARAPNAVFSPSPWTAPKTSPSRPSLTRAERANRVRTTWTFRPASTAAKPRTTNVPFGQGSVAPRQVKKTRTPTATALRGPRAPPNASFEKGGATNAAFDSAAPQSTASTTANVSFSRDTRKSVATALR